MSQHRQTHARTDKLRSNVANLLIKQVRCMDPHQTTAPAPNTLVDVAVIDGKLYTNTAALSPEQLSSLTVINAQGAWLLPGVVDLCARTCEPGLTHKGTIDSETQAAAAGGITHLCCPPDTAPVIDTPAVAKLIYERTQHSGYAQILPWGALTQKLEGELLSEMHALREAGCVGVTQLRRGTKNNKVLLRCLEYAATFDLTVLFQSQDRALAANGVAHSGALATHMGLSAIPVSAETIALSRDLHLVEQTGVTAHFGQLSCARSVELIAQARARGLKVTADVAAHQLAFTDAAIADFDSVHHVIPPYRSDTDRQALLQGLKDGTIGMLSSDHQPHEAAAKAAPFPVTEPGISSLETLLPSTYQWVNNNTLDALTWVRALTSNPARLIGIDAGHLESGKTANLTLFDPQRSTTLTAENIYSAGKHNPWLNQTLDGAVTLTLCEGSVTYQESC